MSTDIPAATPEEQIKDLHSQVSILEQRIKLAALQQTLGSSEQTSVLTSLKAQVSAQGDLDKARAQGDFARLAGIKTGLDSVGAPVGKDGSITVSTGTSGALLLSLRQPMLEGLANSASSIAAAIKADSTAVYIGTDAQVQSALQASVTDSALTQALAALDESTKNAQETLTRSITAASVFATAAAAGLVLNTAVGLEKFFRWIRRIRCSTPATKHSRH